MNQETFPFYERVLERMVAAGWVDRYAFKPEGEIAIRWSREGRRKSSLLRRIVKAFQLTANESRAIQFDTLCSNSVNGCPIPAIDLEIASFWRDCLKDLNLARDEIGFLCLLRGLEEFGPKEEDNLEPAMSRAGARPRYASGLSPG